MHTCALEITNLINHSLLAAPVSMLQLQQRSAHSASRAFLAVPNFPPPLRVAAGQDCVPGGMSHTKATCQPNDLHGSGSPSASLIISIDQAQYKASSTRRSRGQGHTQINARKGAAGQGIEG